MRRRPADWVDARREAPFTPGVSVITGRRHVRASSSTSRWRAQGKAPTDRRTSFCGGRSHLRRRPHRRGRRPIPGWRHRGRVSRRRRAPHDREWLAAVRATVLAAGGWRHRRGTRCGDDDAVVDENVVAVALARVPTGRCGLAAVPAADHRANGLPAVVIASRSCSVRCWCARIRYDTVSVGSVASVSRRRATVQSRATCPDMSASVMPSGCPAGHWTSSMR